MKGTFIVNSGPRSTRESVSLFWELWAFPEGFCGLSVQVLAFCFTGIREKIVIKREEEAAAMLKGLPMLESFADRSLSVHPQAELLWVLRSPGLNPCPREYVGIGAVLC